MKIKTHRPKKFTEQEKEKKAKKKKKKKKLQVGMFKVHKIQDKHNLERSLKDEARQPC